MKSLFDKTTREELIQRINSLHETNTAQWGKMTLYQMLKHCTLCEEMYLGKKKYKRVFIGRFFGKMLLKNAVKDNSPMKPGAPTIPDFVIKEKNGDVASQKHRWINLIEEYAHVSEQNNDLIHPFFGKMTDDQIGYHAYKHSDHHLRQFGA